jgi:F-type H+-transporting ATPase subunit delta
MADNNTIARPYAEAAFEVANETGDLAGWAAALDAAGALLADGQVAKFLGNPSLTDERRLQFLRELFKSAGKESAVIAGGDDKGSNFLKLLLEYGRVGVLPEIAEHFDALKADVENTVDVTITSAAPVSEAQQKAFAKALKERLGRDVRLETQIDETLIGGAVIRAGDVVIDGSLRSRLTSLSNALIA